MRKFATRISAAIILCIMVLSLNTFASSGSGMVLVPKYSVDTIAVKDATRTGKYSYVNVRVISVAPSTEGTIDTYTKCKTVLYSQSVRISELMTISENSTKQLPIKEGYLNLLYFDLAFAGNSPDYGAYVTYSYDGL